MMQRDMPLALKDTNPQQTQDPSSIGRCCGGCKGCDVRLLCCALMLTGELGPWQARFCTQGGPTRTDMCMRTCMRGVSRTYMHVCVRMRACMGVPTRMCMCVCACVQMREAADALRAQLSANPEDWTALTGYLDCLLPGSGATLPAPLPATSVQEQQSGRAAWPRRMCSSSLVWFRGGLAARMAEASAAPAPHCQQQEGEGDIGGTAQSAEEVEAALEEARTTVEGMVAAVAGQQGKGGQVTIRGPRLAKVGAEGKV